MPTKRKLTDPEFQLSDDDRALLYNCWSFLNVARRDVAGRLPEPLHSPLESYLLVALTVSQAGLFWSMKASYGDAGVHFIFPGASSLSAVSQERWESFVQRTTELKCKLVYEA
jgi:hypothetical protein